MKLTVLSLVPFLILGYCQAQTPTFRNPILDESVSFSSVYKHRGAYYMALAKNNGIEILKSHILSNFRDAERQMIYTAPSESRNLGSPRMHYVQGDLYVYFDLIEPNSTYRNLYAIKSNDPCNPLGEWSNETRLLPMEMVNEIKGTVLQHNGGLYLIWSRWQNSLISLYIAGMENPLKVIGPRTLLRTPTMDWEKSDGNVTEGAAIIQRHGATFMVFSTSSSVSEDCCLGIMGIDGGSNPLLISNWWDDVNHCVFARNDVESVWGTCHASFVTSPDDSETWMAYHALDSLSNRTVRIQKLEWEEMNRPKFPPTLGFQRDIPLPKGE